MGKEIENLKMFFSDFVKPLSIESSLLAKRQMIQSSTKTNELLYINKENLVEIYNFFKDPKKGFNLDSADKMFNATISKEEKKQVN